MKQSYPQATCRTQLLPHDFRLTHVTQKLFSTVWAAQTRLQYLYPLGIVIQLVWGNFSETTNWLEKVYFLTMCANTNKSALQLKLTDISKIHWPSSEKTEVFFIIYTNPQIKLLNTLSTRVVGLITQFSYCQPILWFLQECPILRAIPTASEWSTGLRIHSLNTKFIWQMASKTSTQTLLA